MFTYKTCSEIINIFIQSALITLILVFVCVCVFRLYLFLFRRKK